MTSEVIPIGDHEGVELAETAGYYIRRNMEARGLLSESHRFPSIEDATGTPVMHYETMVIRSVETVAEPNTRGRRVRLYPALPINGAPIGHESAPIVVTLLDGTEVRCGFIALLQRMADPNQIGTVYFFSDDRSGPATR